MGEQKDYTINEVAADLRVHRRTVQRLITSGQLNAYRVGLRQYRIKPEALKNYKRRMQVIQPVEDGEEELELVG